MKPTLARSLIKNTLEFLYLVLLILIFMVTTPIVVHNLGDDASYILSLTLATVGYFGSGFWDKPGNFKNLSRSIWLEMKDPGSQDNFHICFFQPYRRPPGAVIIIFLAPCLIEFIFKIPPVLRNETKISFYIFPDAYRIPSAGALQTVPAVLQRFDLINLINGIACSLQGLVSAWLVLSGFHLKEVVAFIFNNPRFIRVRLFVILFKLLPDTCVRMAWAYFHEVI